MQKTIMLHIEGRNGLPYLRCEENGRTVGSYGDEG
jgi:hypothetical protein